MLYFLKDVFFELIIRFFLTKNHITLNVGKIRNYDEERVFFREKKTFSSF